jgi:hypothetical protein
MTLKPLFYLQEVHPPSVCYMWMLVRKLVGVEINARKANRHLMTATNQNYALKEVKVKVKR